MRIQIVDSESGEVIHVPAANQHLEADLKEHFAGARWWQPRLRARQRWVAGEIERVVGELRALTRY